MSKKAMYLSTMKDPDPFMMNKDEVNEHIEKFLEGRGLQEVKFPATKGNLDISAKSGQWRIRVKSKGSCKVKQERDEVFNTGQLSDHLSNQIEQIMRFRQTTDDSVLLFMGNPDIHRIRDKVQKIDKSLDLLGIIRLWVHKDGTVRVEPPQGMADIMKEIGLQQ